MYTILLSFPEVIVFIVSKYFFENNNKLITIEYETDMAISRITREDLY